MASLDQYQCHLNRPTPILMFHTRSCLPRFHFPLNPSSSDYRKINRQHLGTKQGIGACGQGRSGRHRLRRLWAAVRPPTDLMTIDQEGAFEVRIQKHGHLHHYRYRYHPFDVVGWDGYMYPYAISIHDFEPITGRIHQPPPVHQMYSGHNFVVCSFVPRKFDYHPESIPAPYNHSNIDSDEVLYYVEGNFMSRRGIDRGSFTLHPGGIPHGPHPGTVEASIGKEATEELAVMVDTFRPLRLTRAALDLEDPDYAYSWKPEQYDGPGGDGQASEITSG